ncbi:MAG: transcription termination factor NusA [Candidatus Magasanikbacteria bacterium]
MSEITKSIQFICDEKGLSYDIVMEALESALGAAYRKDFGNRQQNIHVKFDPETGDMKVWDEKEVVEDIAEDVLLHDQEEMMKRREDARKDGRELTDEEMEDLVKFNPKNQIMMTQAKEHAKKPKVGDILKIDLEVPGDFGRMAAQTAKQVIIQKLREAERNTVFGDFKSQEGNIVQGIVQRRDRSGGFTIDLGKITGILPPNEIIQRERYNLGSRMKFYVIAVEMGNRGPEIILSRKDKRMVQVVFEQEIPEISSGEVVIKGIARDAGNRSKVAVWTDDENIDPIGSCIGQRGSRITTIIDELGGEKIDIIQYNENAVEYIRFALSPAKVDSVELNEEAKEAIAKVASDQFSLAIGRDGQNVRLATELTGWKIKVVDVNAGKEVTPETVAEVPVEVEKKEDVVAEEKKEEPVVEEKVEEKKDE